MGGVHLDYSKLTPGYRFPPVRIVLKDAMVCEYLRAVHGEASDPNSILVTEDGHRVVPPTAAGVIGMRELMESISLPDGSIHISQEFEFRGLMVVGDTITCQTEVVGKQERGQIRLLTLAMSIFNSGGTEVLTGRIMLTVPPAVLQR